MCKFFKKLFKFIGILSALAGTVAAVYFAVKKFMDKKEASCEDFVPCECCDCDACAGETEAEAAEEAPAENAE